MYQSSMKCGSSVSASVRTPIVKQIDQYPLQNPGALVWESDSQFLYISTQSKWVRVGSSLNAQEIISEPSYGVRSASSESVQSAVVQAFKFLQMPSVPSISSISLQEPGGIVLTMDTKKCYYSTPSKWIEIGQTTLLNSVGTGISLISSYTVPTYNLRSLVAGAGTTISTNLAGTEITISASGVTSISAGPGISITGPPFTPTINNTGVLSVGVNTGISNIGTAQNPILKNTGVISVTVSTGLSNSGTAVNPILLNTGVLTVTAGTGMTSSGSAQNPTLNNAGVISFTPGLGLNNTGTATNPIVNSTASFSSEGTSLGVYSGVSANTVNPSVFKLKTFTQGANITISSTNTDLTFSVTNVVVGISAGTGISITGTPTNPIINNTGVITLTANTGLSNTGTATNPILNNTGVISLTTNVGISNTGTATNPILNNTGVISISVNPGISNTGTASNPILNNTTNFYSEPAVAPSYSIVSTNTVVPTALVTKTITAGSGITITPSNTDLVISSNATSGVTGFSAMKNGIQTFTYVGPNPVGGVITQWSNSGANNFDTSGGSFNTTTGIFTVPANGIYGISATVSIAPNTNQNAYYLVVMVNGVATSYRTMDQPASNVGLVTTLRLNTNAFFSLGDTVELVVTENVAVVGSSFTVSTTPDTWFSILRF